MVSGTSAAKRLVVYVFSFRFVILFAHPVDLLWDIGQLPPTVKSEEMATQISAGYPNHWHEV